MKLYRWVIAPKGGSDYAFRCTTATDDPAIAWNKFLHQFRGSALKPAPDDWTVSRG